MASSYRGESPETIAAKYRVRIGPILEFGNAEQIKWLKFWRNELDAWEEKEAQWNDPTRPLKKFRVYFTRIEEDEKIIEAFDEEDAEERLRDRYLSCDIGEEVDAAECGPNGEVLK